MSRKSWKVFLAALCILGLSQSGNAQAELATGNYQDHPVIVKGVDVPEFDGLVEDSLVAFKYQNGQWQRIALQVDPFYQVNTIDEVDELADCPEEGVVTGKEYRPDFSGTGEATSLDSKDKAGLLDENDEIVFLVADTGEQKSDNPVGFEDAPRYELAIEERSSGGATLQTGYVYLYSRAGAGSSPTTNITAETNFSDANYLGSPPFCTSSMNQVSRIYSPNYCAYYDTRWSLDDLIINKVNCDSLGSATAENSRDVLDRFKGHENRPGGTIGEDAWGCASRMIGEITGPVRYIRGILGAKSGRNTTYYGYFYPRYVSIETRLRVHELNGIARIFDWNDNARGALIARKDSVGSGSYGTGTVDGTTSGDSISSHQIREEGASWWEMLSTSFGTVFLYSRALSDPTKFTLDPATATSAKGFQFYYADQNTPLNESAAHEEVVSSLGNVGILFDLITPPESVDAGASNGTYCQPFQFSTNIRILPEQKAASSLSTLAQAEQVSLGINAFFRSGGGGSDTVPPAPPMNLQVVD